MPKAALAPRANCNPACHHAGCGLFQFPERPAPDRSDRPATPEAAPAPQGTQVRVGGDGYSLGDVAQSTLTPQQFADRAEELLRAQRPGAAARWVQRYPDMALTVLTDAASARVSLQVLHLIAQAHDQQTNRGPSEAGWSALVADREKNAQGYAEYDQRRSEFMTLLQNGQARDALALDPVAAVPAASTPVLRIDAWRLQGIALVLDDRPREAVEAFLAARQLAGGGHPYPLGEPGVVAQRRPAAGGRRRRSGSGLARGGRLGGRSGRRAGPAGGPDPLGTRRIPASGDGGLAGPSPAAVGGPVRAKRPGIRREWGGDRFRGHGRRSGPVGERRPMAAAARRAASGVGGLETVRIADARSVHPQPAATAASESTRTARPDAGCHRDPGPGRRRNGSPAGPAGAGGLGCRGCGRAAPSKAFSCSAGRWKRTRLCSGPSVPRRKRIWAWPIF